MAYDIPSESRYPKEDLVEGPTTPKRIKSMDGSVDSEEDGYETAPDRQMNDDHIPTTMPLLHPKPNYTATDMRGDEGCNW